jgi:hypothetical protein
MKEKVEKADRERVMTRNATLYYQRQAVSALEKEFGFAPARLKEIVPLEADGLGFYIHFRVGEHYYTCRSGKIERTNDRGAAL